MTDTDTCPRCRATVPVVVVDDTRARTLLDEATTEIVAWPDLEQAGADRAVESSTVVVYVGSRLVAGLRVSPGALPGVPRTTGRQNHFAVCPHRDQRPAPSGRWGGDQ